MSAPVVFKVPDGLADKYHGMGYALAASLNGQLIDFVYLRDVLPDFEGDYTDDGGDDEAMAAMNDDRLGPTVRRLQALGLVHAGMLSSWEFVEM